MAASMKQIVVGILKDFERKHLSLIAAGLAYNFIMSLLPALLLLTSLAAYLPLQTGAHGLISFVSPVIPPHAIPLIRQLLDRIGPFRGQLLSFAVLTTLWLTSVATKAIIAALDITYEVPMPRRIWTNRILAIGLTVALGTLMVIGVLLTLLGPWVESLLSRVTSAQSAWMKAWPYAHWILSALFTLSAFELLYLFAPNVPTAGRRTLVGALVATVLLLGLAWGLGWSFSRFGENTVHKSLEALAVPIALAVWLHWSAQIVLLGAELNLNIQRFSQAKALKQANQTIHTETPSLHRAG
jgi:membrane protein